MLLNERTCLFRSGESKDARNRGGERRVRCDGVINRHRFPESPIFSAAESS